LGALAFVERWREHVGTLYTPLHAALLAEIEAEAGEIETALATIDAAIAERERTGQRWFDAEIHRTRGEILLKKCASNPTPAEEAFLTAIAIAQAQKARSFELRAALSLAKLYRATQRNADAHAVLGPALEGFAPTPAFLEIDVAQRFLASLDP
jgi:predicted ATPase